MIDIRNFTQEQLDEFREDDLEGYDAAVRNLNREVDYTYDSYARGNPGFDEAWRSGQIQEFMRINPGHNAISAFEGLKKVVLPPEYDPQLHGERPPHSDLTSVIAGRLQRGRDGSYFSHGGDVPQDVSGPMSTVEDKPPRSEERYEPFVPSEMSTIEGHNK